MKSTILALLGCAAYVGAVPVQTIDQPPTTTTTASDAKALPVMLPRGGAGGEYCDVDCAGKQSFRHGGVECQYFCEDNPKNWRCTEPWPPQCFQKVRVGENS